MIFDSLMKFNFFLVSIKILIHQIIFLIRQIYHDFVNIK